jgi:hypothetical protein
MYPWHGLHRKHCVLYCCITIFCHRNVFMGSLPSNGLLLFHSSGFEPSYYIAPFLRPLIPISFHYLSSLRGHARNVCDHRHEWHLRVLLILMLLVLMAHSLHSLWVWSRAAVPQLLLMAVHLERHGLFVGVPPSVFFCSQQSVVIITGTSLGGWTSILALA